MPKTGQPTRRKRDRTEALRGALVAHDKVFLNMSNRQLAEKYGVSDRTIRRIRSREEVQALEQQWEQDMLEAHRAMGQEALQSTFKLLQEGDPTTLKDYWKRMGITREPQVHEEIQTLKFEVPPYMEKLMEEVNRIAREVESQKEPTEEWGQ